MGADPKAIIARDKREAKAALEAQPVAPPKVEKKKVEKAEVKKEVKKAEVVVKKTAKKKK